MPIARIVPVLITVSLIGSGRLAIGQEVTTRPLFWSPDTNLCNAAQFPTIPVIPDSGDDQVYIQADQATLVQEATSEFSGAVIVRHRNQQLEADHARYNTTRGLLDAEGNVRLLGPGLLITGSDIHTNLNQDTASVSNAVYFTAEHANGKADKLEMLNKDFMELASASYTTCDPEDPTWLLSASTITLDQSTQQGSASSVVMRVQDIPVFYFPYIRFPIGDKRLTGFLYPSFGTSDNLGAQLKVPFYWNIAPNYDATFTPWFMSTRGNMLETEFRYLHSINNGMMNFDYLNRDKVTDEQRYAARWQHIGNPWAGWNTLIDYGKVSDTQWFDDFGNSLNATSITNLLQQARVAYGTVNWDITTNVQAYQTINGTASYERLPQLLFKTHIPQRDNRLNYFVSGELVNFGNPDDVVQGQRFDLLPQVSYNWRSAWGFVTPKLAYRYTQYELDNTSPGQDPTPARSLPTISLDTGLFFDRDTRIANADLVQTLEPRLYYVYTPYRDQSNLPVFDTAQLQFDVNNPVRADYFQGPDRVEDANRLTALLATRFLSKATGQEKFMAGIGGIYYFADELVTLPGSSPIEAGTTYIIGEVVTRPDRHWYLRADSQWDPDTSEFNSHNLRVTYTAEKNLSLLLNHRFTRNSVETVEGGFGWRINPRWHLDGRYLYDLLNDRSQESELGLRYDSCCWALSLKAKERFIKDTVPYDTSVYLEVELKGLSSFGTGI
jgi:LPS-assembly protein